MTKKAKFITLEGIEGVGKSTNMDYCAQWFQAHDLACVRTREPGGTPVGEMIRKILLAESQESILPKTEALLLYAARVQHVEHVIKPALEQGQWVLCDRFTDATMAYQGGGRKLGLEVVQALNTWALDAFVPDLTFLLDAPAHVGLERIRARKELDRIEKEQEAFFEDIRRTYLDLAERFPNRFCVIDATQPLSEVQAAMDQALQACLEGSE